MHLAMPLKTRFFRQGGKGEVLNAIGKAKRENNPGRPKGVRAQGWSVHRAKGRESRGYAGKLRIIVYVKFR